MPPVALEQPQPLPAPLVGASRLSLQPPLSRGSDRARGPDPSLKGVLRAGTWGREVPPRPAVLRDGGWGPTQALAAQGHRAAAAGAADVCQRDKSPCSRSHPGAAAPWEGGEGSPSHHGHARARRALAPCPGAGRLTASPWNEACALRQPSTGCLQPLRPQGLGYAGDPGEDIRWQHELRQGLLRKPRVLSWRGKEQRKWCAVTGTTSRAAMLTAPSQIFMPRLSTEPQKSPVQRGLGRVPRMNPTTLTTTSEDRGCGRALVRVCSRSGLPHAPAGLNTCYSRQGKPLPRSIPQIHRKTDSLTGMQRTSGQARHTISVTGLCMRWTHRAQEGMTHRRSTVKSLEKLA